MKGSIRFMLGLLITFGAAGAGAAATHSDVIAIAAVGIILMMSGTHAMRLQECKN